MPKLSRRALKTWERLGQWYGSKLADSYGPTPPEDWAELIDRTDDERLMDALLAARRETPIFPPTLGQIEALIPQRKQQSRGPSKPEQIAELMLRNPLCKHQLSGRWSFFGPPREFEVLPKRKPPEFVTHPDPRGAQVDACEKCESPSYRVLLEDAIGPGIAA